jgi:hypothetical protein
MAFLNRLWAILPSFGSPIQQDSLFLKQNQALGAAATTTVTLGSLAPAFSKGYVRVKIYGASVAAPTVTSVQVVLNDGTTLVLVGSFAPVTPTGLLSIIPGGTVIGSTDGHITSGAAILTAPSNPFTPAMVGLPISVSTAGTGATILYAYILSYQSAGQVTLDRNAGATATVGVMTLTGQYGNAGVLGTSVGGMDILFPFEVDIAATSCSVLTTLTGATAVAIEDVEVSTTS